MDDHLDPRSQKYAEYLLALYYNIAELLAKLPIPIEISPIGQGEVGMREATEAFDRARSLVHDQNIPDALKFSLDNAMLDWLLARDLLALVLHHGPTRWRFDGVERTLSIATVSTGVADDLIADEDEEPSTE